MGDHAAAVKAYGAALAVEVVSFSADRLDITTAKCYVNRGNSLLRLGRRAEARASYLAVLESQPSVPGVLREPIAKAESRLATMAFDAGDFQGCRRGWERIVRDFSSDSDPSVIAEVEAARNGLKRLGERI